MKTIAVFTGNRAEFGLLLPVMEEINRRVDLKLQLLVAGGHLEKNFGQTIQFIEDMGLEIADAIEIPPIGNDRASTSVAIGKGVVAIAESLSRLTPDILMVYADRFEGFAATIAGSQMGIAVAHLEGGDITEGGALDDSVRHAMTKLSHLHFTTNEQAYQNVLSMGEEEERVCNAGLPSLDHIMKGNYATQPELQSRLSLDFQKPVVVFTQHSVTTEHEQAGEQVSASLHVIRKMAQEGIQFIVTYPNNDAGGLKIIEILEKLKNENREGIQVTPTLGGYCYHGLLSMALDTDLRIACMGNSSSGIKETPVFKCPTVNIGTRQAGRLQGDNVLNVSYSEQEIEQALRKCLFDEQFRRKVRSVTNPYGKGLAAKMICDKLSSIQLNKALIQKKQHFNIH